MIDALDKKSGQNLDTSVELILNKVRSIPKTETAAAVQTLEALKLKSNDLIIDEVLLKKVKADLASRKMDLNDQKFLSQYKEGDSMNQARNDWLIFGVLVVAGAAAGAAYYYIKQKHQ